MKPFVLDRNTLCGRTKKRYQFDWLIKVNLSSSQTFQESYSNFL